MAFNGAGVYIPLVAPTFPAVAQTKILASHYNSQIQDIANALSACMTRGGLAPATANFPMGTNRHTGVGNGVARTDYTAMGQSQDGVLNWAASGGTADVLTATYAPALTALINGQLCFVRAALANATATPSFSPNGLTARTIVNRGGQALVAGAISGGGHELALRYDLANTRWELLNPSVAVLTGLRNRIINGACSIAQRGSLAASIGVTGYGGPDRFQAVNVGAGGQFTQSAATLTFGGLVKNSVRQTVDTGTTAFTLTNRWQGLQQLIEGFNSHDLRSRPAVLSFIFNTNLGGTYSVAIRDGANAQSYITGFTVSANVPTRVILVIPTIPLAASVPNSSSLGLTISIGAQNQGSHQTGTVGVWQAGNFLTVTSVAAWAATAGNFIELTELQLEEGSAGTVFEPRSYGQELDLCQRYYQQHGLQVPATATPASHRIDMRALPTVAGGGAGFASTNTTLGNLIYSQTTTAYQSAITLAAEL